MRVAAGLLLLTLTCPKDDGVACRRCGPGDGLHRGIGTRPKASFAIGDAVLDSGFIARRRLEITEPQSPFACGSHLTKWFHLGDLYREADLF
jgi:hypothetical protein